MSRTIVGRPDLEEQQLVVLDPEESHQSGSHSCLHSLQCQDTKQVDQEEDCHLKPVVEGEDLPELQEVVVEVVGVAVVVVVLQ